MDLSGLSEEQMEMLLVGGALFAMVVIIGAMLAINIAICVMLSGCFKRIPAQHREMEPGMVWLLMIPCFGLIWNFFVFPKLSRSFKSYFESTGRTDVGDCGNSLAWAYAIVSACSIVFGYAAGIAALVLLIIYLVKAMGLKNEIPEIPV